MKRRDHGRQQAAEPAPGRGACVPAATQDTLGYQGTVLPLPFKPDNGEQHVWIYRHWGFLLERSWLNRSARCSDTVSTSRSCRTATPPTSVAVADFRDDADLCRWQRRRHAAARIAPSCALPPGVSIQGRGRWRWERSAGRRRPGRRLADRIPYVVSRRRTPRAASRAVVPIAALPRVSCLPVVSVGILQSSADERGRPNETENRNGEDRS
jgi:hypothetical protein